MRKLLKRIAALALCAVIIAAAAPAGAKYTPPTTTVRIGMDYDSTASKALYLQSVKGCGDGFRFGYYNENREFVSVGSAATTDVAVLRDVNMYGKSGTYSTSSSGSDTTVGYVHILLSKEYSSYSSAKAAADSYKSVEAFVRLDHGKYYVCVGDYTSESAAKSAASSLGITSYTADSGTVYTAVLVDRYTGRILFEFDWGTTYYLGVVPYTNNGVKPQTWHTGYRYYGGFQFSRPTGGDVYCINYVNIEDYVKGVLPYEVSTSWPKESLKAQAVCARTYIMSHLSNHRSSGFDLCTGQHCQVYRGTGNATSNSDAAVDETAGKYLTYNGKLCETYFFSHDGGATANVEDVWGGDPRDYLKGVIDPYEAAAAGNIGSYGYSVTFTASDLKTRLQDAGYSCSDIVNFYVSEFTSTGYVRKLTFVDSNGRTVTVERSKCRSILGLRSQYFKVYNKLSSGGLKEMSLGGGSVYVNSGGTIDGKLSDSYAVGGSGSVSLLGTDTVYAVTGSGAVEEVTASASSSALKPSTNTYVVTGNGWGHGVGLSQWGAYAMAKYYDKSYVEILKFYYQGTTVE
ncbi:MAG: SpoIID/LytB domain-containing protein [Oscillospiraceae bacterium]|nr:SpoIID/LytB domain-containing protein [Oscillospiraceae bacterium]